MNHSLPADLVATCAQLEKRDHATPLVDWAILLSEANPKEYPPEDRRLDARPSKSISNASRVVVLARRRRAGVSLWHPEDTIEGMAEMAIGPVLRRPRNGEPYQEGLA